MKTLMESILNESKEFIFNNRMESPRQKMRKGFIMYNEDTEEIVGFQYDNVKDYLEFMGADMNSDQLATKSDRLKIGETIHDADCIITRIW